MNRFNSLLHSSTRLFILTVLMLLASCGSDGDPVKQQITIDVPESAIPLGSEVIFFVTDTKGELLALEQAFRGQTTVITLPSGTSKKFTLHKLTYTNDIDYTEFRIQSYTNAYAGEFNLAPIATTEGGDSGLHTLQLSNVTAGYQPRGMGSGVFCCSFSGSGGNFTVKSSVPLTGAEKLVYYMTNSSDKTLVPRYKVYTNAQPDVTEILSFNDMTMADKKTLALGEQVEGVGVYIRAKSDNAHFETFSAFNTSTVPLYYPGNVFDAYDTNIEMPNGNKRYYYRTIGAIPTIMKKLPVTIGSFTSNENEFTINKTGSFDFLMAYSGAEWSSANVTHYLDWLVYLDDQTEKFVIPELPLELIARYPELAGASVNFNFISLSERDDLDGYEGWLTSNLDPRSPSTMEYTEGLSLTVNYASGSGRKQNRRAQIIEDVLKVIQ